MAGLPLQNAEMQRCKSGLVPVVTSGVHGLLANSGVEELLEVKLPHAVMFVGPSDRSGEKAYFQTFFF